MFWDRAMRENVERLRINTRQLNRQMEGESSGEGDYSEREEFNQRLEMFGILMEDRANQNGNGSTNYQHNWSQYVKLMRKYQLLDEKIKLKEQMGKKQMEYLKHKYQQEMLVLQAQIDKYKQKEKKCVKEENLIISLKKENRHLHQIYQEKEHLLEQFAQEKSILKKQIMRLNTAVKERDQVIADFETEKHVQSSRQRKCKDELAMLKQQKSYEIERKKQLEHSLQKMREQNDNLTRQIDTLKMYKQQEKQNILEKTRTEILKLEEENKDLKRRNQKLEESFLEHLTQTSLNLQQTFKNVPERTMKNSSLYLNETPIKHRSKGKEKINTVEEQDPQKSHICGQKCSCANQMQRLKTKLRQANNVIVDLLQQKGKGYHNT